MNYKQFYQETNEQAKERFELVEQRIAEIASEPEMKEPFADYFQRTAEFLKSLAITYRNVDGGELWNAEEQELERQNRALYAGIMPENYETSYLNPEYAVKTLGETFGLLLNCVAVEAFRKKEKVFRGDLLQLTIAMELFVEIYNVFLQWQEEQQAEEGSRTAKEIQQIIYWYFHDYSEIFLEEGLRRLLDTREDFETDIVMNADLADLRYLYRYGAPIGENERKIAAFLNAMPEEQIQAMADTYTEGYRIGFETTGKDLSKKTTVEIRYPIGFERMVRAAVRNFEKMNLKPTMRVSSVSPNKQFEFDQKESRALYFDKALAERRLEVRKTYLEEVKQMAAGFAGPAVIEVFGEVPFSPVSKKEAPKYSEKQQQLEVYEINMASQMLNHYIKGEERSFTIIAYPIPAIGERFEEIFAETVKINTLDYMLYRDIQQKIIDVLDTADKVHITGKGANKTDLYVNIWKLKDAAKETAFENCVADVNIPVGEVFTSPVLEGTNGKLFVSQVYLNELNYQNLEIDFKDGMIAEYTCTNFADEAENKKYIRNNVLMHHETLPMGEFAIGTNTTAYRMAREFDIADKLPILIAEKTGPHFAVGDTCYSHEEDNTAYNPDGKAIVARENSISAQRATDMEKAYFNCHTDITIPYDELDKITVIRADGSTEDIISDGRFVLAGTEELNKPLDS